MVLLPRGYTIKEAISTLAASLPQNVTNGNSYLGTEIAPQYSPYLANNPLPDGYPWGNRTARQSNPYKDMPKTGVTRYYDLTIEEKTLAPDGYSHKMLVINGAFPGPTLEANWGDMFQITVHNNLPEGTSLHWHGLLQQNTSYMDGVPGVQQCPIAPGKSYTYRFLADLYGTSWYHSHYSQQYSVGIVGAMIIHGPKNYDYDIDMGPILLQDHYHKEYFELVTETMTPGPNPGTSLGAGLSDNNLINGKNNFNCSSVQTTNPCSSNAGISKFNFQPGKWHRLRLINAGAEGLQHFSIDGHEMNIIAADFVPMVKSTHNVVSLHIGQRMDVLVKGVGEPGQSYWMRSTIQACSGALNPVALAAVLYPGADQGKPPTTQPWKDDLTPCQDMDSSFLTPFFPETPQVPAESHSYEITFGPNSTGYWLWSVNGVSYRGYYDVPTLLMTKANRKAMEPYQFAPFYNAYTVNPGNDTTQTVLWHFHNTVPVAHPIHFHGHNMYLLSQGTGTWDGTITSNPNPTRRDVYVLPPSGHLVFSYNATNPGVWPMHCHIAFHVSAGFFLQTVEQSDWIQKYMNIPAAAAQQCREWWDYSGHNIVPEIDSGL